MYPMEKFSEAFKRFRTSKHDPSRMYLEMELTSKRGSPTCGLDSF